MSLARRGFLSTPLAAAAAAAAAPATEAAPPRVYATGDGVPYTPEEYAQLLGRLAAQGKARTDNYSLGGSVEDLEKRMAAVLGKEAAIWMATGTLANQIAVRALAGTRRRVLVQAESHLYKDCGDCCQTLSGLTMIPLAPGAATFTLEDVQRAASDAETGRVLTPIGAIQIESPVRRRSGERFDFAQMQQISAWARAHKVGMHMDGARLFLECGYTRSPITEYTALFDTVYVSSYKYFNSPSGAILAGPKTLIGGLYHTRRMFGGGLPHGWPFAAVTMHHLEGFAERYRRAVDTAEEVIATLRRDANFEIERVQNGTNIFRLRSTNANGSVYAHRLEQAGVTAATPSGQWLTLQVNETWARVPAAEIVERFRKGLS
ncbi:MAG: low specificity L-threonine aldolase [Acidobacteria bacterium]|nr:low specificity L-threonine aldolase [Acidobacteriota bacterium]